MGVKRVMSAHIGVIGAGLIGGSICKSLRAAGVSNIVVFSPSNSTRTEVHNAGFAVVNSIQDLIAEVDVVFVCVPLNAQMKVFREVAEAIASLARSNVIVTDVSSVKGAEAEEATTLFAGVGASFIPGHPMAGTEFSGFSASTPDMFAGATWVLCPTIGDGTEWERVAELVLAMNAKLSVVDVADHDAAVASISHVPYVFAATLMNILPEDEGRQLALRLSAGSFRDGSRVAGSEPWLSASMVDFNKRNVARLLRDANSTIEDVIASLESGDDEKVLQFFTRAQQGRRDYDAVKTSSMRVEQKFPAVSVTRRCVNECQRGSLITGIEVSEDLWTVTFEA